MLSTAKSLQDIGTISALAEDIARSSPDCAEKAMKIAQLARSALE